MSNELNSENSQKSDSLTIVISIAIAISAGIGLGVGVQMENITLSVVCGSVLGIAIGFLIGRKTK
jgi:hypothetical protein